MVHAAFPEAVVRPRGRPPLFDRATVLEQAMLVFWESGFEASSIADLTTAMGIGPPSLYAAFGDKEGLFLEAVDHYMRGPGSGAAVALAQAPTAKAAIERILDVAASDLSVAGRPSGCMILLTAATCSQASERLRDALARHKSAFHASVRKRLTKAIRDGELPAATDASALAHFYITVFQGISMQARDGAPRAVLRASARLAMLAWPAEPGPA